nr:hypothetical protein [uncultured Arsenicibacter sp.]
MRTFFRIFLLIIVLLLLVCGGTFLYRSRDRQPGYSLNLDVKPVAPKGIKAGFAALKITPALPDTWTDKNNDAKYSEEDGDTYQDRNNNGKFDAFWMAGFHSQRPANGIHDDLWVRAVVIDDGQTRMAIAAVDVLGLSHNNVVSIRKALPAEAGITYSIVCSTHNHEAPDMLGMWGESMFKTGVNAEYQAFIEQQVVKAITEAAKGLQPARLRFVQDLTGADTLIKDTRKPVVKDAGLYMMQALAADKDSTLGSLVVWGNHPETLWSKNLDITSDFPHYVRTYLEKDLGGTVVYASGCVGGLMTTHPSQPVQDPRTGKQILEPSFEKADAEGRQLANLALNALKSDTGKAVSAINIRLLAHTFELPLDNNMFKLGVALGLLKFGYSSWGNLRTEIAGFTISSAAGPLASFLTIPGELYPEIANGGVQQPEGGDFGIAPVETPPLRNLMKGKYKFVLGLANDELGYIVPKSQWDTEAPFTYGLQKSPYGEVNSVGPETAPRIHHEAVSLLKRL